MTNPMVIEITARDNRLGWWGQFHHYREEFPCYSSDYIHKAMEMVADYESIVSVTVDGKRCYTREGYGRA